MARYLGAPAASPLMAHSSRLLASLATIAVLPWQCLLPAGTGVVRFLCSVASSTPIAPGFYTPLR